MKRLNILVIGGTGYLGSNLVQSLVAKGYNVSVLFRGLSEKSKFKNVNYVKGDINNTKDIEKATKEANYVYYFASSTNPKSSENNLLFDISSNLNPIILMLNSCVKNNVKKFIFCSSGGTVYGNHKQMPIKEEFTCQPISSYGIVKHNMEMYIKYFNRKHNLNYEILRLSNPYGCNHLQNPIKGIIPTYINRILEDRDLKVYGDGTVVRDYIYIDDFIQLCIKLLTLDKKNNTLNVGTGIGTSINELIKKIELVCNKKATISYMPSRDFDVHNNFLDITKVYDVYKWTPKISLEKGLYKVLSLNEKKVNQSEKI
tara:strand:+ start:27279 stop:28220 length:942 start_codon:yes stop_codon:yes gene_type:complete